ncbi:MAG: hypothetical protein AB1390_11550 [Nitrospirota bacterium]
MLKLEEIYTNPAVESFGKAFRFAIRPAKEDEERLGISADYASLIELENSETPEAFSEVIKKFLRRYESNNVKKREAAGKPVFRISENDLKGLMALVDNLGPNGIRLVRAALISHALVKGMKEE